VSQEGHFDDVASVYDEALPAHVTEHYLEKRVRFVRSAAPPPARLVDVGCGTGLLAARLAGLGYQVAGLDPSDGMLRLLRERVPAAEAVQGSATKMPFEDDEFDVSISVATMHHIADPADVKLALGEMVRVVRRGGRIIVWDHNPRNPYWPYLMRRVPQDRGDERLVGLEELLGGLEAGGAEPVSVAQLGMVPDFVPRALVRAAGAFERAAEHTPVLRRRCAHNVVLAAKR
jgi:ubiquinone/menaquinone biosynthesis C-methylase UbiE